MLEAIISGVVSNSVFDGVKYGTSTARDLLTQEEYEQEADAITAAVTIAMKESVVPALVSSTGMTEPQLVEEWDWEAIADELDALEVWDQDRATAIVHLTDAIEAGLDLEFEMDSTRRTTLEAAVAAGYKNAVLQFIEEIAGTPIADELELLTDRELLSIASTIEKRLTAIKQELLGTRAELRDTGFVRLDSLYFERHEPGDPKAAWRTGFSIAEVHAGYPLVRQRPDIRIDDRQEVATQVYDRLLNGESLVVKGEGGTGKSTVCRRVACRWHEDPDRGSVLYRRSDTGTSFSAPGTLIDAIRATEDELLVVVEDAPRGGATAIFEVLAEFEHASNVRFLLDTRISAWETMTEVGGYARLERQRQQLGIVDMPALDERECERAIEHYDTLTDEECGRPAEQLYEKVRAAEIGGPLVLAYQLTGPAIDTDRPVSALHADVRRAYGTVESWDDIQDLPQTVAVMVNVLNAAGFPVEVAFMHALADDRNGHRTVELTIEALKGTMIEQGEQGFRLPHQLWSTLYLDHMLEDAGNRLSCDRFERCVDALFRLFDDEDVRESVQSWVHNPSEAFTAIAETPEETAKQFVRQIADIGRIRPKLGQIYGTPKTWQISLPDPCSISAHLQWYLTRGQIHIDRGAFEAAEAEMEQANQVIETAESEDIESSPYRAEVQLYLGLVAEKRGELKTAETYLKSALARSRKHGHRLGVAMCLTNLGHVAQDRGELKTAETCHQEVMTYFQEVGDQHGEAVSLSNLGDIAQKRGELQAAESYINESLALYREIGDRHGESKCLAVLGNIAQKGGEWQAAESYLKESLALKREVGDRHGEAKDLNSLGGVAQKRREWQVAGKYFEKSLALHREVGDRHGEARCLNNLGAVAQRRDESKTAESYFEKSLALYRKVGDRHGEAKCLSNLGIIAQDRGELKTTETYHHEALTYFREIDDQLNEANMLTNLGNVALNQDKLETAESYLEKSLMLYREVGDQYGEANCLAVLGQVVLKRGELKTAESHLQEALKYFLKMDDQNDEAMNINNPIYYPFNKNNLKEIEMCLKELLVHFQDIGNHRGEAQCLIDLGIVAQKRDELEAAESYHKKSLALNQEIGSPDGKAMSLNNLGTLARTQGKLEVAESYHKKSLALEREVNNQHGEAISLINLGEIAEERGELKTAESYIEEALTIARETDTRPIEAKSLHILGLVAHDRDDLAIATEHLEISLEIYKNFNIIDEAFTVFAELIEIYVQRGSNKWAIEMCDEAIEFAERTECTKDQETLTERRAELVATDE